MALTLETGEGLDDSDSFVSLEDVRTFAASRGKSVSEDDTVLEGEIRLAHDYLASLEDRLQGTRSIDGQSLPYPRECVYLYGVRQDDDVIPLAVKNAICQIVIESETTELLATSDGKAVTEETVGPITTKYALSGTASTTPVLPRVENFLRPLMRSFSALSSVRV
jgi:hypothetical protein